MAASRSIDAGRAGDETAPVASVHVGVGHSVDEAADTGDDRDRSITHRLHLSEPTRLEAARHQEQIRAREHQVRQRLVVALDEREPVPMRGGRGVKNGGQVGVARAEHGDPHRDLLEQRHEGHEEVDPLLIGQAGDGDGEWNVGRREAEALEERGTVGRFGFEVVGIEPRDDVRIGVGVPHLGVDAVEDACECIAPERQRHVHAAPELRREDLHA